MSEKYTLYGTSFSLYTGKLRSYLQKKAIPFNEELATTKVFNQLIYPRTGVKYIPVLQTPEDKIYQDTTAIIDKLERRFPENSVYPSTPKQKLVSLLLEVYADEWLVIPAMHYRWAYPEVNQPFIYQEFGRVISPALPKFVRTLLGKRIARKFRQSILYLGITRDTEQAIEASYEQLLADLNRHFKVHRYLLGDSPSIADFGFIGPFFAHLYHDPYPGQILRQTAPEVATWVERMTDGRPEETGFLDADEVPETLYPILMRMATEHLPVLLDTDQRLSDWRSDNPERKIPRSIGIHDFQIGDVIGERAIFPYCLWMFKRPVDFYQCLTGVTKTEVDQFLLEVGFGESLKQGLNNRLVRSRNRLKFAKFEDE